MSKVKHTAGPWVFFDPMAIDYRAPVVMGRGGEARVATAEGGGPTWAISAPEARANAHLITAAPEGLAANQEAADFIRSYFGPVASDDPRGWSDDDARHVYDQLIAAISKATGDAP